jgi:hypothetical protein
MIPARAFLPLVERLLRKEGGLDHSHVESIWRRIHVVHTLPAFRLVQPAHRVRVAPTSDCRIVWTIGLVSTF